MSLGGEEATQTEQDPQGQIYIFKGQSHVWLVL